MKKSKIIKSSNSVQAVRFMYYQPVHFTRGFHEDYKEFLISPLSSLNRPFNEREQNSAECAFMKMTDCNGKLRRAGLVEKDTIF